MAKIWPQDQICILLGHFCIKDFGPILTFLPQPPQSCRSPGGAGSRRFSLSQPGSRLRQLPESSRPPRFRGRNRPTLRHCKFFCRGLVLYRDRSMDVAPNGTLCRDKKRDCDKPGAIRRSATEAATNGERTRQTRERSPASPYVASSPEMLRHTKCAVATSFQDATAPGKAATKPAHSSFARSCRRSSTRRSRAGLRSTDS